VLLISRRKKKRKKMIKKHCHPKKNKEVFPVKTWGAALLLSGILGIGGCGGEAPKPTKVPMPPVEKKAAGPAPARPSPPVSAEVKSEAPPVPVSYTYNPQGKVNPFKPLVVEKPPEKPSKTKGAEEIPADATPLERMDLDKIKLVAIVWAVPDPKAMVEDSGGKGYIISKGTRIGKNKGQVTQITGNGVVVTEREGSPGNIKNREVTLKLYAD
jgi:type IV pilus assembly protein PilP